MKKRKAQKNVKKCKNVVSIIFYIYLMYKMIRYASITQFGSVQASITFILLFLVVINNYTKKIEKI